MLVDVLYLIRNNRSTNIEYLSQSCLINKTISKILNEACLESLSTLDGRVQAIRQIYHIKKCTPVYISSKCILQPLYEQKAWNQTYINILMIKKLETINSGTKIIFYGDKYIYTSLSKNRIEQYLEKCLRIKNLLKVQNERGKEIWQRKTLEILN